MSKPDHMGIEYDHARWRDLYEPSEIRFVPDVEYHCDDVLVGDCRVGILEPRPPYCDRGRVVFKCELPDLDGADGFPRYYMDVTRAKIEIISWLNWRLWRRVVS